MGTGGAAAVKIGDEVVQRPTAGDHRCEVRKGRVVYIHPEGRFYTLEFTYERGSVSGTFRESFLTGQGIDDPTDWWATETKPRGSVAQSEPPNRHRWLENI